MNKWAVQELNAHIEHVNSMLKKPELADETKYRYFLILKQNREFVIFALERTKDVYAIKLRYNAPVCIELTIHEYFEYSYIYYENHFQYWNCWKNDIEAKDSVKRLKES